MATNREIFDSIAESWYGFRHRSRFQSELTQQALRWRTGKVLNLGCGHGPDFLPFAEGFELHGLDFSIQMIKLALKYAEKYSFKANLVVADLSFLPYEDNAFDWAIAIASYHHIKGDNRRQKAFRELRRVLKPGSEAFITVWNRLQPRFWLKGKETYVPWRKKNKTFQRYYYLFSQNEIVGLLEKSGFKIISINPEKRYKFPVTCFSNNICLLIKAV